MISVNLHLTRSPFYEVLSQLQGRHGVLDGIVAFPLFGLNFPTAMWQDTSIHSLLWLTETEEEEKMGNWRTHSRTTSARTLSLNFCPSSRLYRSDVSITCGWMSCRSTKTQKSSQIDMAFRVSLKESSYVNQILCKKETIYGAQLRGFIPFNHFVKCRV